MPFQVQEVICLYAIKSDGIKIISSLLNNLSIKTDMFIAVGILWNLLGNANLNDALIHFNTLTCINELQTSFMNQLYLFHSQSERELRNDILSIITIISKFKLKNRIVDTGLLEKLCLVASFEDNNTKHPLTDRLNLKNNSQDFEMRRLILCIICNLASDTSAQSVISNSGMIKSLLHYFTNPTTIKDNKISTHSLNTWSDSMYEEIQLQSLNTIALLSNNVTFAQKFIDNNITTMLMIFLNWCTTQDGCKSFGNDFHAKGAKNTNLAHIKQALQIIRNIIISSQNFGLIFCDEICDQGLIPILIDYLNKQQTDKLETSLQIEIKYDILLILSIVCQDNSNNKIMFGNAGCDIVIHNMQLDEQKLYSGLGYYKLLIATIGALWSCVINCYGNESYFIERGGARIMMNLLEKIDKSLHNIILGCLTDLCNNPRVFTHLLSWKGKNRITAAHLFCQLWRQEETVMQVIRDENGKISDCVQPIIGKYQVNSEIVSLQSNKKSNSIIDVSDNIRSKIYAFFSRVGYQNLFGLTMTDRMTLEIIKNYLDFKKAEVLEEVEIEICREEHLEIVEEPDREILEAMKLISINKTEKIMQNQSIILKTNHQQELNQETVLYQKIMNNKMLMEESTRLWTEFVKRTSNHTYLTMMREIQLNEVKNTNLSSIPYGDLHRHETMIPNSNVTAFVGKHVKIESTPVKYLGGALNNYDSITGTMKPQPLNNQQHSKCINTSSSTENSIKYDSSTSESKVEAI
ncbi:hypothetical protein A3Q56_02708 [Intoshia linei]|uniref:Cilia- and flagella-associated protein 69 ARM repeats domain-containing protein n=1 Tax=Intoshia linei TaxID=1819745 RepID=A0A177B7B8_9BILA|nr:hypothetical protein A3Q56_02708 [Intoshia linei]